MQYFQTLFGHETVFMKFLLTSSGKASVLSNILWDILTQKTFIVQKLAVVSCFSYSLRNQSSNAVGESKFRHKEAFPDCEGAQGVESQSVLGNYDKRTYSPFSCPFTSSPMSHYKQGELSGKILDLFILRGPLKIDVSVV